jgi:hypothetical protein
LGGCTVLLPCRALSYGHRCLLCCCRRVEAVCRRQLCASCCCCCCCCRRNELQRLLPCDLQLPQHCTKPGNALVLGSLAANHR